MNMSLVFPKFIKDDDFYFYGLKHEKLGHSSGSIFTLKFHLGTFKRQSIPPAHWRNLDI